MTSFPAARNSIIDVVNEGATVTAKKILVLGATGGTGQQLVAQGLEMGHEITVLVRSPARLGAIADRVRVLVGSTTEDGGALAAAVRGQDAVISSVGVGKSFKSRGLIASSAPRIVQAMKDESVRRLIFTSGFGVGETLRDAPLGPRIFFKLLLGDIYADKALGDAAVRASGLDWTIVYPTRLTDGPKTGRYRSGERLVLRGFLSVSRADVAEFLLAQVADGTQVGKGMVITN